MTRKGYSAFDNVEYPEARVAGAVMVEEGWVVPPSTKGVVDVLLAALVAVPEITPVQTAPLGQQAALPF